MIKLDIYKPFANEHSARIIDPDAPRVARFGGRQNNKGGPGVDFLFIVNRDGKTELQAIRFDAKRFTPAQAKAWLKEHNQKFISFEEATGKGVNKRRVETTETNDHTHTADIDDNGNGATVQDDTGHVHQIKDFKVQEAEGHTHELVLGKMSKSIGLLTKEWDFYNKEYATARKKNTIDLHIVKEAQRTYTLMKLNKDIHFSEDSMEPVSREFFEIVKGDRDVRTVIANPDEYCDPSLDLDKHKIEAKLSILKINKTDIQGMVSYELGYAFDSFKPREGDNIIKAVDLESIDIGAQEGDLLEIETDSIEPIKINDKYGIKIGKARIKDISDTKKVDFGKYLMNSAYQNGLLKSDNEQVELLKEMTLIEPTDKEREVSFSKEFTIIKSDRLMKEGTVSGVVYAPGEIDLQDDYSTEPEIRKACHSFMVNNAVMKLMHRKELRDQDAVVVETFIAPFDFKEGSETIKKGSWVVRVKIFNPDLKRMIQKGVINAFSMGGAAKKGKAVPEIERTAA